MTLFGSLSINILSETTMQICHKEAAKNVKLVSSKNFLVTKYIHV